VTHFAHVFFDQVARKGQQWEGYAYQAGFVCGRLFRHKIPRGVSNGRVGVIDCQHFSKR